MNYVITTDATADYPKSLNEKDLYIIPMSYVIDGVLYDNVNNNQLTSTDFFQKISTGHYSSTTMVTHLQAYNFFEKLLKQGLDIIHISFAEPLSGCYSCYCLVAEELRVKYPDRKLAIIDSKCASIGEGILVWYALRNREAGAIFEDELTFITKTRNNIGHLFTIEDIMHLHRGGRLTKGAAIVGKAIQLKPILSCKEDGALIEVGKAIGRIGAIKAMVDKFIALSKNQKQDIIFIQHSDNLKDAETLKTKIVETAKINPNIIIIDEIGPIIGSHLGKGALTLAFKSEDRRKSVRFI